MNTVMIVGLKMDIQIYIVVCVFVINRGIAASVFQQFLLDSTFESKTCKSSELHQSSTQNDVMRCAHECSMDESCKSFFYSNETNICDECKTIYIQSSDAAESISSSSYYSKIENNNAGTTTPTTGDSAGPLILSYGCFPTQTGQENWVGIVDNSKTKCAELCSNYPGFCVEKESCLCHGEISFITATRSGGESNSCDTPCPGNPSEICGSYALSLSNYYSLLHWR